jgi:hypothetical protein
MNGQLHAPGHFITGEASMAPCEDESWRTTNTPVKGASLKCQSFANKKHFYPQTKTRLIICLIYLAEKPLEIGRLYLGDRR